MVEVTGYSDDIISVTSDITEEFERYDSKGDYLAFSDGTVLKAVYDSDGIWRFTLVFKGTLYDNKIEGNVEEDTNDIIIFKDGIKWCLCGVDLAK